MIGSINVIYNIIIVLSNLQLWLKNNCFFRGKEKETKEDKLVLIQG